MNARQLLNEFQQLAILGDLSTRIAGDNNASSLFLANKNAQEKWTSENNFKRQPLLKKIVKGDEPWQLPAGWLWCQLGDVTSYGYSTKVEFKEVNNQTWVLELEDIEKGTSHLLQRVHACDRKFKSAKNRFKSGTVLYGKLRPYLDKVLIADDDGVCSTEIATISFFHGIHPGYLRWYLKSPFFIAYATNSTHGMSLPRLGTHDARNAPFPFPPAEEQKCIVAKIDELILLCDKLEAQREQREKLSKLVRTSTFQALSDAETVSDLQVAWSRVRQNMSLFLDIPCRGIEFRF
jgi:type I restriction enzyme, S subunit